MREVQDLLAGGDLADLELGVSQLQEALYGLNRRLASERKQDSNPLQGLKNTLGSIKDELFADDDWDDWDRGRSRDPWAEPSWSAARSSSWDRQPDPRDRWDRDRQAADRWDRDGQAADRWGREPERWQPQADRLDSGDWNDNRWDDDQRREERSRDESLRDEFLRDERPRDVRPSSPAAPGRSRAPAEHVDPWAED
jgi:molecular chaperone DnaK